MPRERLTLVPTEHWKGNVPTGASKIEKIESSVLIMKDGVGQVGRVTVRTDVAIGEAAYWVAKHLNEAGYPTTTLLYGRKFNGHGFGEMVFQLRLF